MKQIVNNFRETNYSGLWVIKNKKTKNIIACGSISRTSFISENSATEAMKNNLIKEGRISEIDDYCVGYLE